MIRFNILWIFKSLLSQNSLIKKKRLACGKYPWLWKNNFLRKNLCLWKTPVIVEKYFSFGKLSDQGKILKCGKVLRLWKNELHNKTNTRVKTIKIYIYKPWQKLNFLTLLPIKNPLTPGGNKMSSILNQICN